MSENYKKVVNLQSQKEGPSPNYRAKEPRRKIEPSKTFIKKKNPIESIDQVYDDSLSDDLKSELGQIDRPRNQGQPRDYYKTLSLFLFLIIVLGFAYIAYSGLVKKPDEGSGIVVTTEEGRWYSVQLVSKEVYYGYAKNISADPIILEKVYYNYNQISGGDETQEEGASSASIRLVKRGKESHGPDGTMSIIRTQVLFMEPLASESKILKAILDYEK